MNYRGTHGKRVRECRKTLEVKQWGHNEAHGELLIVKGRKVEPTGTARIKGRETRERMMHCKR